GKAAGALLAAPLSAHAGRTRSLFARVLGAAAREIQAPLTALNSFARLAHRAAAAGDSPRTELYLDRLGRHARRLDHVAGELRDLVEVFSAEIALRPEPFDLVDLIREA